MVLAFSLTSCQESTELTGAAKYAAEVTEGFITSISANEEYLQEMLEQYAESPINYDSITNYMKAEETYGAFSSYETSSVKEADDDVYNVRGICKFGETELEAAMSMTVVVKTENRMTGEITYGITDGEAVTFEKTKTLGEKMGNAGLNTLMGMGVVFIVLIIISLIIYLFKFINKAETKLKDKNKTVEVLPEKEPVGTKAVAFGTPEVTDDTELIAVISAAIAAFEGTDQSGFTVRSIRKVSKNNSWKRG